MARLILAFCALGAYALVPPRTTITTTRLHGELGERTSVTLIKGAQPKKLRKKVRRSRSPLLYPAKTAGGGDCFLQLSSDQKHLATSETPMSCFVSRVIARDGDEQQDDDDGVLVMTPTPAEIRQRAPVAPEATNFHPGKLLGDLRTNEKVEAVVLRHIARDVALVAVRGVFRASKAGYRRQSAALPGGGGLAIGDSVDCYVRLSEPNSGRLTVSLAPVGAADAKRDKEEKRLRKQVKRGTLRAGAQRVATVVATDGASLRVDAGGLQGAVAAPADEGPFAAGDRVMVRVATFDAATLAATLDFVPLEQLPEGDGDDAADASE